MWSSIKEMIKKYKLFIILIISFIAVTPSAFAQFETSPSTALSGQELFIQNRCVRCHTIGKGRFVGPDLAGVDKRYSKEEIITWIENPQLIYQETGKMPYNDGYPPMPPMNVPPTQAKAIADYIISFKAPVDPAKYGTITGQVINKTNDLPASDVELILTSFMGDRPTDENSVKSDDQGNFSFGNLGWDRSYGIRVNFKGTEYATDKMVFNPGEDIISLDLPIYEPTFDENDIDIVETHMIVQPADGVLSIANISLYTNSGNKVYVGGKDTEDGKKESLRISLPKGARDLNFIHGIKPEDLVQTDYGYANTTSILPGEKRVVYTYSIPLESGTTALDQIIDYPTTKFLLLVAETEKTATVTGLSGSEQVDVQGQKFLKWTGSDLTPGQKIELRLKSAFVIEDYLKWGVLAFLLVLIAIGAIYSSFKKDDSDPNQTDSAEDLLDRKNALIREIAGLDDEFEAGKIDEKAYRDARESKKEELKKLIRRL